MSKIQKMTINVVGILGIIGSLAWGKLLLSFQIGPCLDAAGNPVNCNLWNVGIDKFFSWVFLIFLPLIILVILGLVNYHKKLTPTRIKVLIIVAAFSALLLWRLYALH